MKNRDDKQKDLEALRKDLERVRNLFVTGFEKLTVSEDFQLRKAVRGIRLRERGEHDVEKQRRRRRVRVRAEPRTDAGLIELLLHGVDRFDARPIAPNAPIIRGAEHFAGKRTDHPEIVVKDEEVEEALTNIHRHANATAATLTLACGRTETRLEIRDDGQGFGPEESS